MRLFANPVTPEAVNIAQRAHWSDDQIKLGYVRTLSGYETVIEQAYVVEAIRHLNMFDSDFLASRQAELDRVYTFINDIPEIQKGLYIDTPENRNTVINAMCAYPQFRIHNIIAGNFEFAAELIQSFRRLEAEYPSLLKPDQPFACYKGYADELTEMLDNAKFQRLKSRLFSEGYDAISDFLDYDYPEDEDGDTTENRMDEAYDQMPAEELQKFFDKYGI